MANNGYIAETEPAYSLEYYKSLYRQSRDAFRANSVANEELRHWKGRDNDFDYVELHGLVPRSLVGRAPTGGAAPYSKSDTFFSEYETHNPASRILYATDESYIIGNLESYDKRQYPSWLNKKYQYQTPEGQGFGHCFVIPRKRVFNIVDPAATADDCALIKRMKADFKECWSNPSNRIKILRSAKDAFEAQNLKLEKENEAEFKATSPPVREDYDEMAKRFLKLEAEDFVFAFHPHPEHSVGHLHMHVFPREEFLRRVSSKQHDKKTIPIEAVIEVEAEDKAKVPNES